MYTHSELEDTHEHTSMHTHTHTHTQCEFELDSSVGRSSSDLCYRYERKVERRLFVANEVFNVDGVRLISTPRADGGQTH